jgi:hypothetical protein
VILGAPLQHRGHDDGMFSVMPQVMAPMGSALSKPVALFLLNTFEISHY